MFGFIKDRVIRNQEAKIKDLIAQARHMYDMKEDCRDKLFYGLADIAREKNITAHQAAATPEGKILTATYVLNRQYAYYLNESAIQNYAELLRIKGVGWGTSDEDWFNKVVKAAGADNIVLQEVPYFCEDLVDEVQVYITP